ncbi:hypothetical protein PSPO01_16108 [Paraphaeosphaeria sporulosa]
MYTERELVNYATENIDEWYGNDVTVELSSGDGLPTLLVRACRFASRGRELQNQMHNLRSGAVKTSTLEVAIKRLENKHVLDFDDYINRFTDGDANVWTQGKDHTRQKAPQGTYRLMRITYVLGHTLNINKVNGIPISSSHSASKKIISRLLARQVKSCLLHLQKKAIASTVETLEQVSRDGEDCLVVFVSVIIICFAFEDQQKTILVALETQKKEMNEEGTNEETLRALDVTARADWKNIDNLAKHVMQLFRHYLVRLGRRDCRRDSGDTITHLIHDNPIRVDFFLPAKGVKRRFLNSASPILRPSNNIRQQVLRCFAQKNDSHTTSPGESDEDLFKRVPQGERYAPEAEGHPPQEEEDPPYTEEESNELLRLGDDLWSHFGKRTYIERAIQAYEEHPGPHPDPSWSGHETRRFLFTDPLHKETTKRPQDEYMAHYYYVFGFNIDKRGAPTEKSILYLVENYYSHKKYIESQPKSEELCARRRALGRGLSRSNEARVSPGATKSPREG